MKNPSASMSYKYYLAFTVFLIFKYNSKLSPSSLLECIRFSIQSEILFLLLVYVYLKLIHNMPSLALIDDTSEQFADQEPRNENPSPTIKTNAGARKSDIESLFASIKVKSIDDSKFSNQTYSDICKYFNNFTGIGTNGQRAHAKIEEVKKNYLRNDESYRHNEQLENDKCLFVPGKVSQITERFQKNLTNNEGQTGTFKIYTKREKNYNSTLNKCDPQEDNIIEEIKTSIARSLPSADRISYSWVFGDSSESTCDLQTQLPLEENVDFQLGELRSFKRSETNDKDILNEVLTCNVIDQKTCDWRSVKKELKSNLEKLKPVAIIDPLTLPAKLNGFENVISNVTVSPLYSLKNINAMTTDQIEESKNGYTKKRVLECNAVTEDVKQPSERPLSPIPEIVSENDNFSFATFTTTDKSSLLDSANFYLKSGERSDYFRNEFCIFPEDLYPCEKYEIDENDNVRRYEDFESISLKTNENLRSSCSFSLPLASPIFSCTSECQVEYLIISLTKDGCKIKI